MKTLAELKQMTFIPHHECGCCGSMIGWRVYDGSPWFDSSCGCGCSPEHPDTWENAFRWYNSAFEHESDEAIQAEWARSSMTESSSEEYHVKCESDTTFKEHTISQITDRLGNVVKLPFPIAVTASRFDKHSAETVLMQVIKKLSDHIIKRSVQMPAAESSNIVNDLKSDAKF